MILKIAVCEDNEQDRESLASILRTTCSELNLPQQISFFVTGDDFLTEHKKSPFDIVFMNIFLQGTNSMDTIRNAVQSDPCQIIFTTSSTDYAYEAFALNAVHYLLKPLTQPIVTEAIKRCLPRLSNNPPQQLLELKTVHGVMPIPMNHIRYIEVSNKICSIYFIKKRCLRVCISLNALYKRLDSSYFMRAQRSFVVNMHFIDVFYFDHIILQGGMEIVLSRNNRAELKKQYQQFLFRLARRELL